MNRLAHEPSLYLRQHADNPVDWYAWGDDAFAVARTGDRPVLLSIGYSSCHWCHVMAHESFEDPDVAAVMNELFVNVKVDREERPDVDAIYMDAVQAMTGQGGWPLTVFLTPDGRPFWGGTYFPRHGRGELPGVIDVLRTVHAAYADDRARVEAAAESITSHIAVHVPRAPRRLPEGHMVERAAAGLLARYEPRYGGFEQAPKFPPPMALELLMRADLRDPEPPRIGAVTHTLDHMLWGGMYDQVGGGFHRYSVDDRWLIPHFEKMLYDNAQLARTYALAYRVTGEQRYERAATETLDFLVRDLRVAGGALGAAQDADSDGVEGRFYAWTPGELSDALGEDDAAWVAELYRVTDAGNFEGWNVLSLGAEPSGSDWERLAPLRARLLARRSQRVPPPADHKVVAAWNGLAIAALAQAAMAFERDDYLDAARDIARHLLDVQTVDGVLHRTWHENRGVGVAGFAEDHASVAFGLLELYEATFELRWFEAAVALADRLLELFDDHDGGGFFATAADSDESLVIRPKDLSDHPVPSGNSMSALVLARLAQWYPERPYRERAEAAVALVSTGLPRMPSGLSQAAIALDQLTAPAPRELVVVVPANHDCAVPTGAAAFIAAARAKWRPHLAISVDAAGSAHPGHATRTTIEDAPTAYLCTAMSCDAPTTDPQVIEQALH